MNCGAVEYTRWDYAAARSAWGARIANMAWDRLARRKSRQEAARMRLIVSDEESAALRERPGDAFAAAIIEEVVNRTFNEEEATA